MNWRTFVKIVWTKSPNFVLFDSSSFSRQGRRRTWTTNRSPIRTTWESRSSVHPAPVHPRTSRGWTCRRSRSSIRTRSRWPITWLVKHGRCDARLGISSTDLCTWLIWLWTSQWQLVCQLYSIYGVGIGSNDNLGFWVWGVWWNNCLNPHREKIENRNTSRHILLKNNFRTVTFVKLFLILNWVIWSNYMKSLLGGVKTPTWHCSTMNLSQSLNERTINRKNKWPTKSMKQFIN